MEKRWVLRNRHGELVCTAKTRKEIVKIASERYVYLHKFGDTFAQETPEQIQKGRKGEEIE